MKTICLILMLTLTLKAQPSFVHVDASQLTILIATNPAVVQDHELILADGELILNPHEFEILSKAANSAEVTTTVAPADVPFDANSTCLWTQHISAAPVPMEKRNQVYFSDGNTTYVAYVTNEDFYFVWKLLKRLK